MRPGTRSWKQVTADELQELLAPAVEHLDRVDPGGVVGVYLYGSAVTTGLRPDSDIDLLLITHRSLTTHERAALVSVLLNLSGWRGHADRFPEAAAGRPIDLTGVVLDDVRAWTDPPARGGRADGAKWDHRAERICWPRRDLQFGEWLRADLLTGDLPQPTRDPDVVTLLATTHQGNHALRGPALNEVIAPVPTELLHRALVASIPQLLDGMEGDEDNTLLTLARILVTLRTGRIVAKDAAAEAIVPMLDGVDRELLELARSRYLGAATGTWSGLTSQISALAHRRAVRALHGHRT